MLINTVSISTSINIKQENETNITKNNIQLSPKINEIIEKINETVIKKFLHELISIGPRMTDTYGCKKAGDYIYNNFQEFNLESKKLQWKGFGNIWHPGFYDSYNIEGTLKGEKSDEAIIFNAHYDTVEDTVGANDDGSGVVGVLAAAYALSQYNFNNTLKFVTFSGEEIGLKGSTKYVKNLYKNNQEILVEINADMIGRAVTKEDGRRIRLSYSEDTVWITDIIENIVNSNNIYTLDITGRYPMNRFAERGGSDYFPFIQHGYESVCVWEGCGDPNMHTPRDNLSNVNISYLVNTTRTIAATMAYLGDINDRPPKVTISAPKKGKLYLEDKLIKEFNSEKTVVIDDIWIYTDIKTFNSPVEKMEVSYDGEIIETIENPPYVYHLNKRSIGEHRVNVTIYDQLGRTSSDYVSFYYFNPLKNR